MSRRVAPELLEAVRARHQPSADLLRAVAVTTVLGGREILRGVDLAIRRGEVFVIMGPSGCGKTTMLRHLCGLQRPSAGTISVEGRDVYALDQTELDGLRLRTGLAFQGGALLGSLSVEENVALPLRENTDLDERVILQVARMKLDMVGLLHARSLLPASLSGGMKKRAAIARAIALDPEIVFLDEPSAGLDPVTAAELDRLILDLRDLLGTTVLVVTHELASIHTIADHLVMIDHGQVVADGATRTVTASTNPVVRAFFDRRAGTEATGRRDGLSSRLLPRP